jgi:H-type small acid-soluble spore protein
VQRLEAEKSQQIFESLGVVDVLYNGSPVWIEDLDGEEAKVRYLESDEVIQVHVAELVEGESIWEQRVH